MRTGYNGMHVPGDATVAVKSEHSEKVKASYSSDFSLHDNEFVDEWIMLARRNVTQKSMLVSLDDIEGWKQEAVNGNICHETGRFFSIIGVHVRHRVERHELEWDQPIIEQPETGILGIMVKSINDTLHFCMQAKEEPGNIGGIQLSPTVQATYSNYTGAHGGASPLFLEHFISPMPERIIFARLQTEDGGRFLYKSNRNMIVFADENVPLELPAGFIWLTLQQLVRLIRQSNLVNACARSVLSSLVFAAKQQLDHHTPDIQLVPETGLSDMLLWLDAQKAVNHMQAKRIGLNELCEWKIDDKGFFSHNEKRFFRIVGLKVATKTREVRSWGQPILENPAAGVIGLLMRNGVNGVELLMQAKAEVGNRSTIQLAPTVQFTQGNYEGSIKLKKPFLYQEFLHPHYQIIHESRQTEEGARFYREYHLHRILMLPDGVKLEVPHDYRWLPLDQVVFLLHLGEQVNSCARSVLACLL